MKSDSILLAGLLMFSARATAVTFVVGRAVLCAPPIQPHASNKSTRAQMIPPHHRQKGNFPGLYWPTDDYPCKPYQGGAIR